MYWDAYATLSGVARLRRIVADAKDTGLTDDETQPITLKQARELLVMIDDGFAKLVHPRFEVQIYRPGYGWQAIGRTFHTKTEGLRILRGCAGQDARLVRLVPKVLALQRSC